MIAAHRSSPASRANVLVLAALMACLPGYAAADFWGGEKIVGSGTPKTEAREVTAFQSIALDVAATLELRQGDTDGLTITGDDNIVPLIETVVENGTLKIRWAGNKRNYSLHYKKLQIVVNARTINSLSVTGSGDIHAAKLKSQDLRTTIGGSGDITIDILEATSLKVGLTGSGDVTVGGKADTLDVSLTGSGDVAAAKLDVRSAKVSLQGSGDVSVWATESLKASVAGSGDIIYSGKPKVAGSVTGSGSVHPARGGS